MLWQLFKKHASVMTETLYSMNSNSPLPWIQTLAFTVLLNSMVLAIFKYLINHSVFILLWTDHATQHKVSMLINSITYDRYPSLVRLQNIPSWVYIHLHFFYFGDQRDSMMSRTPALHLVNLSSIPSTLCYRFSPVKNDPWAKRQE